MNLFVEKVKTWKNAWKILYQQYKVSCEFFSVELDSAVRIRNKMQVVYKEMTCDGAKSNLAKWNLIGATPFKHLKNCLMFMWYND